MMNRHALRRCLTVVGRDRAVHGLADRAASKVRIIQTNSAGDNVHLIDPATNKVVGVIEGIEVNHGAAVAPDGSRIYISNEADSTLDFVDAKTLKVTKKVPLTGHPNNIAVGHDGRRVYVGHPGARAGRRRRDRHRVDEAGQDDPDAGHHPQCVRHSGRQVRGRRLDFGRNDQRDRRADRRARVDAEDGSGHPADDVLDQSRRLDEVDLRAVERTERICGRRFRDAQGDQAHRESRRCLPARRRSRKDPIRRTAWRSPRTARRWSSAAA